MIESPFQKAYDFEEKYGIDRLKITIQKAENAYKTYQPETIGLCKNILESICKTILEEKNETYNDKENAQALVGKTLNLFSINSQISGGFCNIIGGCSQIAKGIGEIRNEKCITGHGATNKKPLPTKTDIDICVSTVLHIIDIIHAVVMNNEIDILSTKIKYEKIDEISQYNYANQYIDNNVNIEYENGILFIDGTEFRPSKILYNLERLTYDAVNKECFNNLNMNKDYLEELVLEYYQDRFIDDNPAIIEDSYFVSIFEPIIFQNDLIYAKGSISWEEIEYDEDSDLTSNAHCTSWFEVKFSYEFDSSINNFIYNVEFFEFES